MNEPRRPGPGNRPGPNPPWHSRRPNTDDDQTSIARSQPGPPRRYPPPAAPPAYRPPQPPDTPWYLQRPNRSAAPKPLTEHQKPTTTVKDARPSRILTWLLVGAGGLALLTGIAVLAVNIPKLAVTGGTVLDVRKVQAGVLQTLSDPASGYGANTVTDVSCNNGHNPSADKGTAFTCDATVNGTQRHVAVLVSDDNGTYEIDGPR